MNTSFSFARHRSSMTLAHSSTQATDLTRNSSSESSGSVSPPRKDIAAAPEKTVKQRWRRASMRQLSEMKRKILIAALSTPQLPRPKEPPRPMRLSRIWTETELELDSLQAAVRPRKQRSSISFPSGFHPLQMQSTQIAESAEEEKDVVMLQREELKPAKNRAVVYINLPKLPFGRHKSYNEEKDIRSFFVSRRNKAWRRLPSIKATRSHDRLNVSHYN